MSYQGIIHRYHEFMDLPPAVQPITLYEGNTPLIPVPAIADNLGGGFELYAASGSISYHKPIEHNV